MLESCELPNAEIADVVTGIRALPVRWRKVHAQGYDQGAESKQAARNKRQDLGIIGVRHKWLHAADSKNALSICIDLKSTAETDFAQSQIGLRGIDLDAQPVPDNLRLALTVDILNGCGGIERCPVRVVKAGIGV